LLKTFGMKSKLYYNFLSLFIFLSVGFLSYGQELNAEVIVDASRLNTANLSVFKTLEKDLNNFINSKHWTRKVFGKEERIKCTFILSVVEYKDNNMKVELHVSASRPVYNSTYETLLFSVKDENVKFSYQEYQPLIYNEGQLDNNLTAVIAYYAYMILGYQFHSFKLNAGKPYFEKAKNIQSLASGQGWTEWDDRGKFFSRAKWVDQLLNPSNMSFAQAFYTYHRFGLDMMADQMSMGKANIVKAINYLNKLDRKRSDLIIKLFFDAKADEITGVLKEGPRASNLQKVKNILLELAPYYADKWKELP